MPVRRHREERRRPERLAVVVDRLGPRTCGSRPYREGRQQCFPR